jgi:hypothetical protein
MNVPYITQEQMIEIRYFDAVVEAYESLKSEYRKQAAELSAAIQRSSQERRDVLQRAKLMGLPRSS